jgi:hypothetical protein
MNEPINNYEFDLVYGSYKAYVNELRGVYHRLIWNFPNHERVKFWEKRKEYWQNYDTINLGYKAFDSIQALDTEILKILPEATLSKDLEGELLRNQKTNYKVITTKTQYFDYCNTLETLVFSDNKTEIIEDEIDLLTLLIEDYDTKYRAKITETEHLLSSPKNAEMLMKSIKEVEDGADLIQFDPTKD